MLVLASVLCSLGLFGYIGVETTMLTIEVIPFLILAVGVDNLFILVHANRRISNNEKERSTSEIMADTLSEAGPSILLSAISQGCCFGIGALTEMPAVQTFALYAMVAVFFNLFLQITAFIALMAMDLNRYNVSNQCISVSVLFFAVFFCVANLSVLKKGKMHFLVCFPPTKAKNGVY